MNPTIERIFYFLHRCRVASWWVTRPLSLGVKALVVDDQDRVLLVRHTYQPGWHIPGGKVEKRETLPVAAARELKEEVGVDVPPQSGQLFSIYANFGEYKSDHITMYVFKVNGNEKLSPRRFEIADCGFFSRNSLPNEVTSATKRRLAEYFGEKPASIEW